MKALFLLFLILLSGLLPARGQQEPEQTLCDVINGGLGSVDVDSDGIEKCVDNCMLDANPKQKDSDRDGIGDACEGRERKRKEWEERGRELRRQAREPVNLSRLVNRASDVVLGRLNGCSWREAKGCVAQVEVIRRFKDSTNPKYLQYERPVWVYVPDGGAVELVGELLLLLKNTKARNWVKPDIYPAPLKAGAWPDEYKYFRYELVEPDYGVLGVSPERLTKVEKIIKAQRKKTQAHKSSRAEGAR
jgi:hypothetical protein